MLKRSVFACALFLGTQQCHAAGSFSGSFDFHWSNEPSNKHRIMVLLSPVSFKDGAGKVWQVPKGAKIDGASIPPALWSFAGSPFTGNYRRASVIHDFFCDTKTEFASGIHKMFKEAMATDGISGLELASKYAAVKLFGTGCGKPDNLFSSIFTSQPADGIAASAELKGELESLSATDDLPSLESRTDKISAIARVDAPRTFAAMTEFRRIPSETNLQQLENAISAEQPSDEAIDTLTLLAIATVPEGSALPPAN